MEHCKLCGSPYVEIHHCLHGTANRKKADKYNLVIPLCHEHHIVLDSLVESGTFPGDGQRYVLGFIDHFRVDSKKSKDRNYYS